MQSGRLRARRFGVKLRAAPRRDHRLEVNVATRNFASWHQRAEGVNDLQARRWMLDYGSYAGCTPTL
jgi:hypothetical protein